MSHQHRLVKCATIHSPSIILMIWVLVTLAGIGGIHVRVTFMIALAVAFVAEERVKWQQRRRRRDELQARGSRLEH